MTDGVYLELVFFAHFISDHSQTAPIRGRRRERSGRRRGGGTSQVLLERNKTTDEG